MLYINESFIECWKSLEVELLITLFEILLGVLPVRSDTCAASMGSRVLFIDF